MNDPVCAACGLRLEYGAQATVLRYGKLVHMSCQNKIPRRSKKRPHNKGHTSGQKTK